MSSQFNYVKVAVHGVPRSGTSWVGEILNSSPGTLYRYQPLFSYAHKDFLTGSSSKKDINAFFSRIIKCNDSFTNQSEKRISGDFPKFEKEGITHVIYKEVRYMNILYNMMRKTDDVLLCAVIRNPLAVISSWLKAPREFRKDLGWSETEEWRYALKKNLNRPEEFNGYEKWKEAANIFLHLKSDFPNRVYILKYIDMVENPQKTTEDLFSFLKINFSEETRDFLLQSTNHHQADPYAVFKKKIDDDKWKLNLKPEISEQIIKDIQGTYFEKYLNL